MDELVGALGTPTTQRIVDRFHRFAYIPDGVIVALAGEALHENWGANYFALEKYLAIYVSWSIEQGRFTHSDSQFITTAGYLQTRYGTPLYCVFERNAVRESPPFALVYAGSRVGAAEFPAPPDIPSGSTISPGAEIVMLHDHILGDHADRVAFLSNTPPVAQMCAIAGAIQWSLNRKLHIHHWYYGAMSYVVPLYLQSREDITLCPDLIAPIQVSGSSLLVRTVLLPHMPYANARVGVVRHDQLPPWLLQAWNDIGSTAPTTTADADVE